MASEGIAYIKIAKIDGSGKDNSQELSSLTKLSVPYSDVGNVTYNILSRTKKPTYWLYQVQFSTLLTSNSTSLDYSFTGSYSASVYIPAKQQVLIYFDSGSGDQNGFYSYEQLSVPQTGSYTTNIYPTKQIILNYKATSSAGSVAPGKNIALRLGLKRKDSNIITYLGDSHNLPSQATAENINLKYVLNGPGSASAFAGDQYFLVVTGSISYNAWFFPNSYSGNYNLPASTYFTTASLLISSTPTGSGEVYSTIIEPGFTQIFQNSDCDVLAGNATSNRFNPFLQDVDYSTSTTQPVNYLAIQNNNATKATVPESNYTQLSSTNIRYKGSKNQSDKINQWIPSRNNIGTYGKTPSVESLDTTIYEFRWGGATNPEIQGFGGVKMGKLLSVNTKNSVKTINPSEGLREISIPVKMPFDVSTDLWHRSSSISQSVSDYYYILNGNNPENHEISMYAYPNNENAAYQPTLPSTTKILTTEYCVPQKSTFIVTSSAHGDGLYGTGFLARIERGAGVGYPEFNATSPYTASYIRLFDNQSMNFLKSDYSPGQCVLPSNILITGSDTTFSTSNYTSSFIPLADQLNNGERWFATFYEKLEYPWDSNDLVPAYLNSSPLGKKGVAEIVGIYQAGGDTGVPHDTLMLLKHTMEWATGSQSWITGSSKSAVGKIGAGGLGMLMWKARDAGKSEFVLVQDMVTGGVGNGAFTSRFTTQEITENFEEITKTFGSNPK